LPGLEREEDILEIRMKVRRMDIFVAEEEIE